MVRFYVDKLAKTAEIGSKNDGGVDVDGKTRPGGGGGVSAGGDVAGGVHVSASGARAGVTCCGTFSALYAVTHVLVSAVLALRWFTAAAESLDTDHLILQIFSIYMTGTSVLFYVVASCYAVFHSDAKIKQLPRLGDKKRESGQLGSLAGNNGDLSDSQQALDPTILSSSPSSKLSIKAPMIVRAVLSVSGICCCVMAGMQVPISFQLQQETVCGNQLTGIPYVLLVAFILVQFFYIFGMNKLHIGGYGRVGNLMLMHCIATNVHVWFWSVLQGTTWQIVENAQAYLSLNTTGLDFRNGVTPTGTTKLNYSDVSQYYEAVMEYWNNASLRACPFAYLISMDLQGTPYLLRALPYIYPHYFTYVFVSAAALYAAWSLRPGGTFLSSLPTVVRVVGRHKSTWRCRCSTIGNLTGLLMLAGALLHAIVLLVLRYENKTYMLLQVSYAVEIALLLLISLALIPSARWLHSLHVHPGGAPHTAPYKLLLYVSSAGQTAYVISILTTSRVLTGGTSNISHILAYTTYILNMLVGLLQTFVIADALQRFTENEVERKYSGKEMVRFLILSNVSWWLVEIFEPVRERLLHDDMAPSSLGSGVEWAVIRSILMPAFISYKVMSAICLGVVRKQCYPEPPRYKKSVEEKAALKRKRLNSKSSGSSVVRKSGGDRSQQSVPVSSSQRNGVDRVRTVSEGVSSANGRVDRHQTHSLSNDSKAAPAKPPRLGGAPLQPQRGHDDRQKPNGDVFTSSTPAAANLNTPAGTHGDAAAAGKRKKRVNFDKQKPVEIRRRSDNGIN